MGMMTPWCSRWSSAAYERDSGTALRRGRSGLRTFPSAIETITAPRRKPASRLIALKVSKRILQLEVPSQRR